MITPITLKLIRASVTYGYIVGGIPLYWNRADGQVHRITSRVDRLRYGVTLFLTCLGTVFSSVTLRAYTQRHGFFFSDENAVIRTCMFIIALTSNLFIFNSMQYAEEFASTINKAHVVYEQFEDHLKARGETRSKNWCDEVFGFVFLSATQIPFFVIVVPVLRCDVNIFYGVVPDTWVCSQSVLFSFGGFDIPRISGPMICFALIQMVFLMQVVGSGLLIICVWFPHLFLGNEIMHILNSRSLSRISKRDFIVFRKSYRCFRIIQKKINLCLGQNFMTGHMPLFSSLFILCVVGLIKADTSLLLFVIDVGWIALYLIHYILIMSNLWKFSEITEELLRNVRFHRFSKLDTKILKSFRPMYICFGSFGDFNKNNYIFIGNFVLGLTINVLMMQPNAHNQQMRF